MTIRCGSQVTVCELPISYDTYSGCSHRCAYCFAQTSMTFDNVEPCPSIKALEKFISGSRTQETKWCDWDIPLHWGGMSDPFQPAEEEHRASLEALKVFERTGYPFVVSTKGRLVAEDPYLSLLGRCNCVVQISMACTGYDKLEQGAPTFGERVEMVRKLSPVVKRVIARIQPFIPTMGREIVASLSDIADAGAFGVTVEGIKFKRKKPGTVRVGGDWCYQDDTLESWYLKIREECRRLGLAFYCAENRLRSLGDGACCCGVADIPGFRPNGFNCVSVAAGSGCKPTKTMLETGTGGCFQSLFQTSQGSERVRRSSFAEMMLEQSEKLMGEQKR